MAKKTGPKYPHRGRLLRKRLLSQVLLLLIAAAVITFYAYMKTTDEGATSTLLRLGESIGGARQSVRSKNPPPAQPDPAGQPAPVPSPPSSRSPAPETKGSAPPSTQAPSITVPGRFRIDKPSERPSAKDADGSAQRAGAPDAASAKQGAALPFEGLSLEDVARKLSARYAGAEPGQWGERVPGVVIRLDDPVPARARKAQDKTAPFTVALTFDACGGGKDGYDADLIAYLREQRIPATLFLTSLWMRNYPDQLRDLAADPLFEIAAHGERHRPCSVNGKSAYGIKGTASLPELVEEVLGNARLIAESTGNAPRWFRSGTAFYDEIAVDVIHDLGMSVAGYSIAGDQGATLSAARVASRTLKAGHGDILLFHMNKPRSGTREGLKRALPALIKKGAVFVRLSDPL